MKATIPTLAGWTTYLAKQAKSVEGGRANDVRAKAPEVHSMLVDTFAGATDASGPIFAAYRNGVTVPNKAAPPAEVLSFWQKRYPQLPESNDREAFCRWYGILIMLLQQSIACHDLLVATDTKADSKNPHNANSISASAQTFVAPRIEMKKRQERKDELNRLVLIASASTARMQGNLSLPVTSPNEAEVEQQIGSLKGGVNVVNVDDKGVRAIGLFSSREIAHDSSDPDWRDMLTAGGETITVPSRAMMRLPLGSVERFACDSQWPNSVPTRTIEWLLSNYRTHLLELRLTWWEPKKK